MNLFRRGITDQVFWDWFAENQARIAMGPAAGPMLGHEITKKLRSVHPGLVWEIGQIPDGRLQFAVSAEGILDVAPVVRRLVAAAPAISGWSIVAFRQKDDRAATAEYRGARVSRDDLFFGNAALHANGQFRLSLFVKGLEKSNFDSKVGATVLLLDSILGEELAMTKIGYIDYFPWEQRTGSELAIGHLEGFLKSN